MPDSSWPYWHQHVPILHYLLEFTQSHNHWVSEAIQSSHPQSSSSPPALDSRYLPMSRFFASDSQSVGATASASVLPMNIQDWFPLEWTLLAGQGTLKSLLQHNSSKASILHCSAFFMVQLSHPYLISGKTIAWLYRPLLAKSYLFFLIH